MSNNIGLRTFLLEVKDKKINTSVDVDKNGMIVNISPFFKKYVGESIFIVRDKLKGRLKRI